VALTLSIIRFFIRVTKIVFGNIHSSGEFIDAGDPHVLMQQGGASTSSMFVYFTISLTLLRAAQVAHAGDQTNWCTINRGSRVHILDFMGSPPKTLVNRRS